MATRSPQRVRCSFVAIVLSAVVIGCTTFIGGCEGRDNVPGGGALGGIGGSDGDGGDGGSSATISCNPTGTGCLCIVNDAQPGQLTACGPTSVPLNEAERGVCCVTQSICACIRYTCRSDPASAFCQCGSVANLATVTLGSPVAECPTPTATQKCCFSPDNATCICSGLGCGPEEMQVESCSATAAGACAPGEDIAACR
jgi:hypothetical protein